MCSRSFFLHCKCNSKAPASLACVHFLPPKPAALLKVNQHRQLQHQPMSKQQLIKAELL